MKIPDWVKLGKNVAIEENVQLGLGREELGDLLIGDNCKIRSGTIIYRGARLGDNCQTGHNSLIREKNYLGHHVVIGSFTELAPGNQIGNYTSIHSQCFFENVRIGDYVFVAPGVKFLDDLFPVDPDPTHYRGAIVGNDTAIGGGCTILPFVNIGQRALIGSGSVVTKDIPDGEVWVGNPAKFLKKISNLKKSDYIPGTRKRYESK